MLVDGSPVVIAGGGGGGAHGGIGGDGGVGGTDGTTDGTGAADAGGLAGGNGGTGGAGSGGGNDGEDGGPEVGGAGGDAIDTDRPGGGGDGGGGGGAGSVGGGGGGGGEATSAGGGAGGGGGSSFSDDDAADIDDGVRGGNGRVDITYDDPECPTDLEISKSAAPTDVSIGDEVTYTIEVTNNGPGDATGGVVSDDLPGEVEFDSDDCGGANIPPWTWEIGNLATGGTVTCELTVDVVSPGEITNVSVVDGNEDDPNPANNEDDETIIVEPEADLAIEKVASPTSATVGDEVTYTLTVENLGPDDATGVTVLDDLPAEVEYVSDTCGGADIPPWTWEIGELAADESVDCAITVETVAPGTADNTASVEGDQEDPNPDNNTSSATVTIEDEDEVVPPTEPPEDEEVTPPPPTGILPVTGASLVNQLVALGLALAALGAIFLLSARRIPKPKHLGSHLS